MYIPNATTGYARLAWDSTVAGYPAGLTLGNLAGANADVAFTGDDQPFYMLAFTDSTDSLGQTDATDQILMIEFQSSSLTGLGNDTMALDPSTTLFNLYDNTQSFYLGTGQHDTNSLDGWLTTYSFLTGEALQQVRIGIGMAGGDTNPQSLTVNSLDIETPNNGAVPEPTSILLLLTVVGITGKGIYRRLPQNRRS